MKRILRIGEGYALSKHKLKHTCIRYFSLLAVATIMCLEAHAQRPQTRGPVLSGIVEDVDGQPIAGATIRIPGQPIKSISDAAGRFAIQAPTPQGRIYASYVGFKQVDMEFSADSSRFFRFVLSPIDQLLEEVQISTGYQTVPRERATGSFESLSNELLNRKTGTNLFRRIDDLASGVSTLKITPSSGMKTTGLTIRGPSSIGSSSQPLVVIDGFPYYGDLTNLNPHDVETVTLLTDAAASSIWGAASGNGVIVINTKKAAYNTPLTFRFNTNFTVANKPDLYYLPQISTPDYIDAEIFLYEKGFYTSKFDDIRGNVRPVPRLLRQADLGELSQSEAAAQIDALRQVDMRDDFLRYVYRRPFKQQYSISAQGGSDYLAFNAAASVDRNLNEVITSAYNRMNLRLHTTIKPYKWLRADFGMIYTENRYSESSLANPIAYNAMGAGAGNYPYMQLADEQGNPLPVVDNRPYHPVFRDTVAGGRLLDWTYVPLAEIGHSSNVNTGRETLFNANFTVSLTPHLSANVAYSYANQYSEIKDTEGMETFNVRSLVNLYATWDDTSIKWNIPIGDHLEYTNNSGLTHIGRAQLNYNRQWSSHRVDAIAGTEIRDISSSYNAHNVWGFNGGNMTFSPVDYVNPVPLLNGIFSSSSVPNGQAQGAIVNRYLSYYANVAYSYKDRYTLSSSARKDASNLFGVASNRRWSPFWSVGAAWNLANESFFPKQWFSEFKLRGSFGYNGNVNPNIAALPLISYSPTVNGVTGLPYAQITTPANTALRWEKVGMWNLALDFQGIDGRLAGTVEYYSKQPTDVISESKIDPTSGFLSMPVNSADLQGRGVDINLRSINMQRGRWQWTSNLIFSYNRTRVKNNYLANTSATNFVVGMSGTFRTPVEGKDLYSLYTFQWAGLDPETGDPRGYWDGEISKDYISLYFASQLKDLQYHGPSRPLYVGSFRNTLRFGRLEASCNIAYHFGYKFLRSALNYSSLYNAGIGHAEIADRWRKPGDELHTNVPSMIYPANSFRDWFYEYSAALVESGSFVKLRDVTLSYDIKPSGSKWINGLTIYSYIANVGMLWRANKSGIDPEYGRSTPEPRAVSIGFNCQF
ncbi:SusC/RagA family TonB-linked outer membrane protein [Parapedobacter defluvii]|uniref:SusC/RagA family TonB-linked outer membrane protein n=1 Tax=Parapedobacter defluvii TaxID=2045106 RepID=UPI00333F3AD5